ncbi:MAG: capsular biosynthesis protein [Micrococcaceae bacterium]
MTYYSLTGGNGFLGWHTRALLHSEGIESKSFSVGQEFDVDQAKAAVDGSERLIHIAGVNRGTDDEVADGNVTFARQVAQVLQEVHTPPRVVSFANSIQADLDNIYGQAKSGAAKVLQQVCDELGIQFENVLLPNLFGEHGKPNYNSFVATFCYKLAHDETPSVNGDTQIPLLHVQNAAKVLTGMVPVKNIDQLTTKRTVPQVLEQLEEFKAKYDKGEIPSLQSDFDLDLFNTYRSYVFEVRPAIELTANADNRGHFVEMSRAYQGDSQSSFSTTVPGITRGQHYHRRKIERFVVMSGTAEIGLRKLLTDEKVTIPATADKPIAVDMPTFWPHNITNTGDDTLHTFFWTNDIFNPDNPDTYPEDV